MLAIRPPAVAGSFYPAQPAELGRELDKLMSRVTGCPEGPTPKVMVVPHAGYVQGYRGRGTKGEKQTKVMMARGWQSISDRAKTVWAKHVPFLKLIIAGKR